jgi:uncharacterized membrane protein YoaK (UPF0700 family)
VSVPSGAQPSPPGRGAAAPTDPAALRREAARTIRHPLTRSLLLLTFSTGLVDAGSYLGLGHVFTANMTGNVVLLGFGLAGAAGLPVVAPLVSLGAFLLGAGTGGLRTSRPEPDQGRRLYSALGIETILITTATAFSIVVDVRPNALSSYVVIGLLAFALGLRNATVRKIAVPDLSTTVLTMTLTGLAADSRLFGGSGSGTVRRGAAVVSMLLGAVCGALLVRVNLWAALAGAATLAFATLIAYRAAARPPPATTSKRSPNGGQVADHPVGQ